MAALLWSEWQQQQQQTFVLYITIQQPLLERILVWRHGKRGEWRGGCRGPLQSSLTDGAVPPPIFEPCTQFDLNSVDARTPCHVAGGCGGRNRLSPVGGAANGIPLYLCRDTETSLKNVVSTTRQSCTTAKRRASTVSADAIFIYIRGGWGGASGYPLYIHLLHHSSLDVAMHSAHFAHNSSLLRHHSKWRQRRRRAKRLHQDNKGKEHHPRCGGGRGELEELSMRQMIDLRCISFLEQQVKRIEILKTKLKANDNKLLQAYMVSSLYTLQPLDRLDYAGMLMVGSRKEIKEKENSVLAVGRNILY